MLISKAMTMVNSICITYMCGYLCYHALTTRMTPRMKSLMSLQSGGCGQIDVKIVVNVVLGVHGIDRVCVLRHWSCRWMECGNSVSQVSYFIS